MQDEDTRKVILKAQRNEITEHFIYQKISQTIKDPNNRDILKQISDDEYEHYQFWKNYTHEEVKPNKIKVWTYFLISRIFGVTFGIKLMEKGEEEAQVTYNKISDDVPDAKEIVEDEDEHEEELIKMIDEERLKYVGSIVLGLNDALVELTGALAGYTFVLRNTTLIAMSGLITGIAGSLSMAASEYLSAKSESSNKAPLKSAFYTGSTYVLTVMFLILPYLIFAEVYASLGSTILIAMTIIFIFNFYVSVARDVSLKSRFLEMASLSFGIATLTFIIGFLVRTFLPVEI